MTVHMGEISGKESFMDGRRPLVVVRNLVKVFGDGYEVRALDGVSLTVEEGAFVAVMGASGSGKSTLLHMVGGLDRPTSGEIVVDGQDITRLNDLDSFRNRYVGFVFQLHNLIPTLTSLENVEIPMYETPMQPAERHARARELLELVGLGDRLHFLPNKMSGGQRQRVAIARALANRPRLILADEPTGNLDSKAGAEIIALLQELNRKQGVTIVLVTHDSIVANAAERIIVLRDGQIVDGR